jgi:hypothetical protein
MGARQIASAPFPVFFLSLSNKFLVIRNFAFFFAFFDRAQKATP